MVENHQTKDIRELQAKMFGVQVIQEELVMSVELYEIF